MKRGETWAPEGGDVPMEVKLTLDGIALSWRPQPGDDFKSLIFFAAGKYQARSADAFIQVR